MRRWLLAVLVMSACGGRPKPAPPITHSAPPPTGTKPSPPTVSGDSAAAGAARQLYASTCAMCHGPEGRGDGPAAASISAPLRDYSDPAWQASVTDDQLAEIIVKGGQAVGKSPFMPANPQLADKPEAVNELVKLIRSFRRTP